MKEIFKAFNQLLRVIFVGFIGLYAIAKLFGSIPNEARHAANTDKEKTTSEFDEIW